MLHYFCYALSNYDIQNLATSSYATALTYYYYYYYYYARKITSNAWQQWV